MSIADVDGSVTAPTGFRAAGIACGIKKNGNADLALIVSDVPASGAAVFTTNKAQAAPVLVSKARLAASGGRARVVVDQQRLRQRVHGARRDGDRRSDGRRGRAGRRRRSGARCSSRRPASSASRWIAQTVTDGIAAAVAALSRDGGAAAARAIMTTDPFPKEAAVEVATPAGSFRVGGIAKGSGMIEPLMATMLGVVTTDAQVAPALLQRALTAAVDVTFNAITVDGECSTNDCVFALANGASGVDDRRGGFDLLAEALRRVCERAGDRHRPRRRRGDQARHDRRHRRAARTRKRGRRRGRSRTRRS